MTQRIDIIAERNALSFSCQTNFSFHCCVIVEVFLYKNKILTHKVLWLLSSNLSQTSIIYDYAAIVAIFITSIAETSGLESEIDFRRFL